MGTKSDKFLFEYRITNTKTQEVFQARGWSKAAALAGVPSSNATNLSKTKKWKVEIVGEPEEWDESAYRSELYKQTKGRYPGYEERKQLKDPQYEKRKRIRLRGMKNMDDTPLTAEQHDTYRAMSCEVCGESDVTRIRVDHCHETGYVRGSLCHHCNVALGHLKDNPHTIQKLYDYLMNANERIQTCSDKMPL